jgi:hypothetical protein
MHTFVTNREILDGALTHPVSCLGQETLAVLRPPAVYGLAWDPSLLCCINAASTNSSFWSCLGPLLLLLLPLLQLPQFLVLLDPLPLSSTTSLLIYSCSSLFLKTTLGHNLLPFLHQKFTFNTYPMPHKLLY